MHNFLIALFTLLSTLFVVPAAPVNISVVSPAPELTQMSILDYYYVIPSKYFLNDLIMDTKERREAALNKLMENERMGINKELFSGENKDYKENNSDNMLAVVDEDNYYLGMNPNESYGDYSQGFSMTVFIKSNGEHVVAMESHSCSLSCKPESANIFLLTYKNGKWSDVTDQLLPLEEINNSIKAEVKYCEELNSKNGNEEDVHDRCVVTHGGMQYNLPQHGTTITAFNGLSEIKFSLKWKNDKFEFELVDKNNS